MINRILRSAPRSALQRVARAPVEQWCEPLIMGERRNLVGHLGDWQIRGIFPMPDDVWLTEASARCAAAAFSSLVRRRGIERAVDLVKAAAKRQLGKRSP